MVRRASSADGNVTYSQASSEEDLDTIELAQPSINVAKVQLLRRNCLCFLRLCFQPLESFESSCWGIAGSHTKGVNLMGLCHNGRLGSLS